MMSCGPSERVIRIGMPQMAAGCLSENWLLKELGSFHWDRLCASLGHKSHELADSEGRRLYATFVRVRMALNGTLADFHEGDDLRLGLSMKRFGRSSLMSEISIEGGHSSGEAIMMSTFSFRTAENNTSLTKSEPASNYDSSVAATNEPPTFFSEYSEVRRNHGKRRIDDVSCLRNAAYQINPFTDSNGANLLYFASYQSIHDFLSSRAMTDFHTKSRDVCYFRNCNLGDTISIASASDIVCTDNRLERADILFRASDGESIAYVSTLKERANVT